MNYFYFRGHEVEVSVEHGVEILSLLLAWRSLARDS